MFWVLKLLLGANMAPRSPLEAPRPSKTQFSINFSIILWWFLVHFWHVSIYLILRFPGTVAGLAVRQLDKKKTTWLPKSTENQYFFWSKMQFMLRCVENRSMCLRTYYLQYFVASGPPNKAPKIVPTSMEIRSQEPSMLRPIFSTLIKRLQNHSEPILRQFF